MVVQLCHEVRTLTMRHGLAYNTFGIGGNLRHPSKFCIFIIYIEGVKRADKRIAEIGVQDICYKKLVRSRLKWAGQWKEWEIKNKESRCSESGKGGVIDRDCKGRTPLVETWKDLRTRNMSNIAKELETVDREHSKRK